MSWYPEPPPLPACAWQCAICKPNSFRNLSERGLCGHTRAESDAVTRERMRIALALHRRGTPTDIALAREIEERIL